MTTSKPGRTRRALAVALAALLLLAIPASAGFPTFDIAAFGQRIQTAITQNAQLVAIGSVISNTTTMITALQSQLDQAFRFAEGQISALTNWQQLFPVAEVLGTPAQVQGWITRARQVGDRARRVASGALAALPAESDIRGAWAAAPLHTPLGPPPVAPPPQSRADLAAQRSQDLAALLARFDAIAGERGAAAERNAQLLDDIRQRLDDLAADPGVSGTALQQKQISAAAAAGDLMAAQLQLAALREEQALEERAAAREALAALDAANLAGIEAAFNGTDAILALYDATGADAAFSSPALPVY